MNSLFGDVPMVRIAPGTKLVAACMRAGYAMIAIRICTAKLPQPSQAHRLLLLGMQA